MPPSFVIWVFGIRRPCQCPRGRAAVMGGPETIGIGVRLSMSLSGPQRAGWEGEPAQTLSRKTCLWASDRVLAA